MEKSPRYPGHVVWLLVLFLSLAACHSTHSGNEMNFHPMEEEYVKRFGRTFLHKSQALDLISAGSGIAFETESKLVKIDLLSVQASHAYVAIQVNGDEVERFKVRRQVSTVTLTLDGTPAQVRVVKDTEAIAGSIRVAGVWADGSISRAPKNGKLIEFIGNSITSAMGADLAIPCDTGQWFDQHRGSLSYGAQIADSLSADYLLNSVSGYGVYRNWNDENVAEPTLPQVYENLYLNQDSTVKYQPKRLPDLISICLGTNDLSAGDGTKPRRPFDRQKFVSTFRAFVQKLYERDPEVKIILVMSPMVTGEKEKMLEESLQQIRHSFAERQVIEVFKFSNVRPAGCTGHPTVKEHQEMATQLLPLVHSLLYPS